MSVGAVPINTSAASEGLKRLEVQTDVGTSNRGWIGERSALLVSPEETPITSDLSTTPTYIPKLSLYPGWECLVEVIHAPDKSPFLVTPRFEVFHVQISDCQHHRSVCQIRA